LNEIAMRYIIGVETTRTDELGGKGRSLAALERAGLPVPPWFVVSPTAFRDSVSADRLSGLSEAADFKSLASILDGLSPSPDVAAELRSALRALCPNGEKIAVRSSALDEDGPEHSFAGQLDSFLFVPAELVGEKIAAVWRSGFSERILAYRREHALTPIPSAPAVILQRMIDADVAGVAFSADPVGGRRAIAVVSAVYGLGSALVSGESDADTYLVDRGGHVVERRIAVKLTAHRASATEAEGVAASPVGADIAAKPALTDGQAASIAAMARLAERHFGRPQDIEWAMRDHAAYLVQSRPITTLADVADPDGERNLWDNSNIAESYNGVTTPLTYSFARTAYEHVYRWFCRLMGVDEAAIAANDSTFRRMIGMVDGRIYYNLVSWYRVLALLPGFKVNRPFMEKMMGVKEGLPDELLPQAGRADRIADTLRLLGTCSRLVANHFTLTTSIANFTARLNDALAPPTPPLHEMRADELAAHYRELERKLLPRWDAPLINDFFAMIYFGLLGRLAERWCGDDEGSLANDLISGQGGIISAEPARRIEEMARIARWDAALVETLRSGSVDSAVRGIRGIPELAKAYDAYLERFGDRCLEELKLESATLHDDPSLLIRSIGQFAGHVETPGEGERVDLSSQAERAVARALSGHPIRRALFALVLRNARSRVRDRENLRFERTRLFGRVRRIVLELGRRFAAEADLDDPRDIFYLDIGEVIGFVDGTATTRDVKGLIGVRKAEYESYRTMPAPPDRFETFGVARRCTDASAPVTAACDEASDQRKGIGCCPGIVTGRVRVITDPRNASLESGAILVAERTDPGWIMLFPAAKGVLVERGSLLSHSAIVARELGIPTVVSIPGITAWLKDGDLVRFDGATGVVRRIADATEGADGQ
jgi:pyruvate,water dikinase